MQCVSPLPSQVEAECILQAHLHGVLPVHQAAFTSLQQSALRWSNRLKQACAVCHSLNMVSKSVVAGVDMEHALFKAVEARFLVLVSCPNCTTGTRMHARLVSSGCYLACFPFSQGDTHVHCASAHLQRCDALTVCNKPSCSFALHIAYPCSCIIGFMHHRVHASRHSQRIKGLAIQSLL